MNETSRGVLSRYLEARTPDAARQAAAWDAIEQRVASGDQGPSLPDEPAAGGSGLGGVAKLLIVGLIVGGGVLGAMQLRGEEQPVTAEASPALEAEPQVDREPVAVESPVPAPVMPTELVIPAASEASEARDAPAEPRARKPRAGSRAAEREAPAPAPAEQDASTLAEEMKLLARGQRALKQGDPAAALRAFDEHAHRFPDGALADERRVQRAQALCGLGRVEEARKAAQAFVHDRPGSPHAGKASRICREDGE